MNFKKLLKIFADKGCRKIYAKWLSPNDNSKNQVYLAGSFDVLNIFPIHEIIPDNQGDRKKETFKAKIDFFWVTDEGVMLFAPNAQFILYPEYPEVRFSGFLKNIRGGPSELMTSRLDKRLLFMAVTDDGRIIAYVVEPDSELANEFRSIADLPDIGVFKEITLEGGNIEFNSKKKLIGELKRIHKLGWIDSKRLDRDRNVLPCSSSNCGGYTLEAELGITPNGYSQPDYLGWEVKQFSVSNFERYNSAIITLMTPEPTHGYYVDSGIESFIRKYGYDDKLGREARINFGGIHRYDVITKSTSLKLVLDGFDITSGNIQNANGFIGLIDADDKIAASWSFASLLKHWNTKHANACYVPSKNRKDSELFRPNTQQYFFGGKIILGSVTDFTLFLAEVAKGHIYYDPGIKLELEIIGERKKIIKRRSQFRIKSEYLKALYRFNEIVDVSVEVS